MILDLYSLELSTLYKMQVDMEEHLAELRSKEPFFKREAKARTPEPVNVHIRKLERKLFHTWAFIMEEGLYSETLEYVNEHKGEETPFEW